MQFEETQVAGIVPAFRGMRNPYASWFKSDSKIDPFSDELMIGNEDKALALKLMKGGTEHAKFTRQIVCWVDITAPLYWWKQFDCYRFGVEKDSTSTMHSLMNAPFRQEDFAVNEIGYAHIAEIVQTLNNLRSTWLDETYDKAERKRVWDAIISILPESYRQKRTVMMSYQAISAMVRQRKGHKLGEWKEFIGWAKTLPESWLIFGEDNAE